MECDQLVCLSGVLKRNSGGRIIEYRTKSEIKSGKKNSFTIVYPNLVLDVLVEDNEDDQPLGYDEPADEPVAQGFHIRTGWMKEHTVARSGPHP